MGLNSTPDSGASFSCRCTTSNVIDRLRGPKAVNDVRSRALARKTGTGIWRRIYGADFWSRFLERVSGALRLSRGSQGGCPGEMLREEMSASLQCLAVQCLSAANSAVERL